MDNYVDADSIGIIVENPYDSDKSGMSLNYRGFGHNGLLLQRWRMVQKVG